MSETTGATTSAYAYAGGPLELDVSGSTNWYLTDPLGSVRLVTDASGDTPASYAYAAFGSTRSETGSLPNEVRFTGERTDNETGLEFLRARTYDPATGTFLQRDTWGITATDSQSIDPYASTQNSPVNLTDPSGHDPYWDKSYDETGTTVFKMPGAKKAPAASSSTPAPSPSPSPPKASSSPTQSGGWSWNPLDGNSCESQGIGGVGNLWAQGPGSFINDHSTQILVVIVIAGSIAVCEWGSEVCATLILGAIDASGTVCVEDEAACQELVAGGGESIAASIDVGSLTLSNTVANEVASRPYISVLNAQQIIESGTPIPDPGGIPGGLRWDVPGFYNGAQGVYQLVVDVANNKIVHFLFVRDKTP